MQNGWRHELDKFAPETAVGTGAVEPLVDEYKAAEAVPTVDEHTLDEVEDRQSQNKVRGAKTVAYSGEDVGDSGTGEVVSTGEELEVREAENSDNAYGAQVSKEVDDAEVNQPAEDVRPEEPQAPKRRRKAVDTV
jgi:hypothetical protein